MAIETLIHELGQAGIRIWLEEGQLRWRAAKGALTPELRERVAARKDELVQFLTQAGAAHDLIQLQPDLAARHQPFPLTDMQQAYWLGRSGDFQLGNLSLHGYFEIHSRELDLDRFAQAWNQLIARHEMLRAVVDGDGQQRILAEVPAYRLAVDDLRGRPEAEVAAVLADLRERLSHAVADLTRWPSFEVRASLLDGDWVRLHFGFDGTFTDNYSMHILFRELVALYEQPQQPLLPTPLEASFRDYVLAVAAQSESPAYARALSYWRARLEQLPPPPELPLACQPESLLHPRFSRRIGGLEAAAWARVRAQAQRLGLTPPAVVLGAFALVLARWSRNPAITLNVPLFNRQPLHPHIHQVLGNFSSFTLVTADRRAPLSFRARAADLQEQLRLGLEHSAVSGVHLLRELAQRSRDGAGAAMPVVFTSDPAGVDQGHGLPVLQGELGEVVYTSIQTPQVWIDLQVSYPGDRLVFDWDGVEALFPAGLLDDMCASFQTLLEDLAAPASDWEQPCEVRLPAWQRQLLAECHATTTTYPRVPLQARLAAWAERQPAAPALIDERGTLDWATLAARVAGIASGLHDRGLGLDQPVALLFPRRREQVLAALGCYAAGVPFVPLDPHAPAARLRQLLQDCGAALLLAEAELAGAPAWLSLAELPQAATWPQRAHAPEDPAYIIYTSGSTGAPKGVAVPRAALENVVDFTAAALALDDSCRALAVTALHHDLAIYDLFGPLCAGGSLVLTPVAAHPEPELWAELVVRHQVTLWNSVPALMEMLLEGERELPSLRHVVLGGDWVPLELPARLRRLAPAAALVTIGGPTETTIWNVWSPVTEVAPEWRSLPYGRAIANNRTYVLDEQLDELPVWVAGELVSAGVGLALGYWRDPQRSDAAFITHPHSGERLYRTGDLGWRLPDGRLEILGRVDHQIKLQGVRIEPGEIEAVLRGYPGVAEAVVCAVGPRDRARHLVAFVVAAECDESALLAYCRARLPAALVPARINARERLPLTANGKLDRARLAREAESATAPLAAATGAPRDATEQALARIWAENLGLESVGLEQHFFELGGNSLLATRLIRQVAVHFGCTLSLRSLIEAPTLADFAATVRQARHQAEPLPALLRAPEQAHLPFALTEVQEAYWIGRGGGFELGNVATHITFEVEREQLEPLRFEAAWNQLIARHPMLRAVFDAEGQQRVLAQVPYYKLAQHDLRGLSPAERDEHLAAVRARMSTQILAADQWPLFEVALSRLTETTWRIHVDVDGLIADAWSNFLLMDEWQRLYREPELALPALDLQFRDYIATLAELKRGAAYGRARAYWLERIERLPPAPELPLARLPTGLARPSFQRLGHRLEATRWQGLEARAQAAGLTGSILLLAIYAEVLGLWSASDQFTLNLTLFHRVPFHPDVDRIVGDFTAVTLLEVDQRAPMNLLDRARALQQQLWQDIDHRDFNGIEVIRELVRRRAAAPGATMPVVFTSALGVGAYSSDPERGFGRIVWGLSQTPQVWLDMQVVLEDGDLTLYWDAVVELFPDGLLETMFGAYRELLTELADDESAWQRPSPLALPADQRRRRALLEATEQTLPSGLLQTPFFEQARRTPTALALIGAAGSCDYTTLCSAATRLARALQEQGLGREELVAVVMDKSWAQVLAVLAILEAGGAYLPIDAALPAPRRELLLRESGARLVLAESAQNFCTRDGLVVDERWFAGPVPEPLHCPATPDQLAYVIFTSGSTGTPKGVMIEHRASRNTLEDLRLRFGLGPADRVLGLSALSFDLSVFDIFGLLGCGGALVLPEPAQLRDPAHWFALLERHGVTVWNSVPALMAMLADYLEDRDRALPSALRLVMLSGDWIPVDLPVRLRACADQLKVLSLGGATEAAIWSILHDTAEPAPELASVPYGKALANQFWRVLHRDGRPCPEGVAGDLYIGGAGLARGYLGDTAKTAASFVTVDGVRLYRTGDRGRLLADGRIELLGREDQQVKIQGYRIELGEIEVCLREVGARDAAVVVRARPDRQLVAFAVADSDEVALRRALSQRLPAYMVPVQIQLLERLPQSANGKLDRRALVDLAHQGPAVSEPSSAPTTDSELACEVRAILAEVLEQDDVAADANLLELGLTSVGLARAFNRLEERFGRRPEFAALYADPVVSTLIRFYEEGDADEFAF